MSVPIVKLENPIQPYAWGSHRAIAALQGRATPTRAPEAELWIGDHPKAPSRVESSSGSVTLTEWIERDRSGVLGPGRNHLPFLTKVLAAERSLSLQVHPNRAQAKSGFERESRARVPSERRNYSDPDPKHEVLVALSAFEALCGFRVDREVAPLLDAFPSLAAVRNDGSSRPLSVRLFYHLQRLDAGDRARLADDLESFSRGDAIEALWASRLAAEHPGDPLAIAPLLLNPVILEPGQGLVVRPGTVHAYLSGAGVEIMTRSDNVIRAGLTRKHVDAEELGVVIADEAGPAERVSGRKSPGGATDYATGTDAFSVRALSVGAGATTEGPAGHVTVLLCVKGEVRVVGDGGESGGVISLQSGEAALVPAGIEGYRLLGSAETSKVFEVSSG